MRCPPLELHFVIDKDYDASIIYNLLRGTDPAGWQVRSATMGLDRERAQKIHDAPDSAGAEAQIRGLVDARYSERAQDLETARRQYEMAWQPLLGRFSEVVTAQTGHCWFHPTEKIEYTDVVSAFHRGTSDWYGNKITTKYDLPAEAKLRNPAYEISLSHVFHIIRKYHSKSEVTDWQAWALSELTANWILGDPRFRSNWPSYCTNDCFAHSGYPQLAGLEKNLAPVFTNRRSFRAYLEQAVARIRTVDDKALTTP